CWSRRQVSSQLNSPTTTSSRQCNGDAMNYFQLLLAPRLSEQLEPWQEELHSQIRSLMLDGLRICQPSLSSRELDMALADMDSGSMDGRPRRASTSRSLPSSGPKTPGPSSPTTSSTP